MRLRPLCMHGVVCIEYKELLARRDGLITGDMWAGPVNFFFTRYGGPTSLRQPERQAIYDKFILNTRAFVGAPLNEQAEDALLEILRRVLREVREHFGFEVEEEVAYEEA